MAVFDRIKFDGLRSRDWIVYKHPAEAIVSGCRLIVGEGQIALFVKNGQVCDAFEAGAYTLESSNLPILQSVLNAPFGGKTPYPAEIYYINITNRLDVLWGTVDPIQIVDPKYFVKLRVRAFGQMGLKIEDCVLFLRELIGALGGSDVVRYDKIVDFYRGVLMTKVKSIIAGIIVHEKISALEITAHLDDISEEVCDQVREDFERFGFAIVNFFIQSINFPDEDFAQLNHILEQRAQFEIMGDTRYTTKRSFDVYETAAANEGGVAGVLAAGGVGLGMGAAMASATPPIQSQNAASVAVEKACSRCGASNETSAKFCSNCGHPMTLECPLCNAVLEAGDRFCSGCGEPVKTARAEDRRDGDA